MHWALQSIKRNNRRGLQAGLVLTILMGLAFLLTQVVEYAHVGFNTGDGAFASVFFGLTGLHGAHVFVGPHAAHDRGGPRVPRPLLARAPPRRRDPGDLLALRRRDVDRRLRDGLPHLVPSRVRGSRPVPARSEARTAVPRSRHGCPVKNPLRDEATAFRLRSRHARRLRADRGSPRGSRRLARRGGVRGAHGGCALAPAGRHAARPRPAQHVERARGSRTRGACSSSPTRRSAAPSCGVRWRPRRAADRARRARRLPGAELAAPHLDVRRGRCARRGAGAARREPRRAARGGGRSRAARSATATRCRRSRTRCGRSRPTRSSSRPTRRARRTGSSAVSSTLPSERFDVPVTHVVVEGAGA